MKSKLGWTVVLLLALAGITAMVGMQLSSPAPEDRAGLAAATGDVLREFLIERPVKPVEAEPFEAVPVNGASGRLADYAGKYVLLNFWATWCVPCKTELPALQALHDELADEAFVVLAVAMAESEGKVAKFLESNPLTFPVLADPDGSIAELYGVDSIPLTYLITPAGQIEARALGPREWNDPALREYFRSQTRPGG